MKSELTAFGSAAIQTLHMQIQQCKAGDPFAPVTVCAPTPYTGLHIRKRLASLAAGNGSGGLLNVRFVPLPRIAELIGAESLASTGLKPASNAAKMELVRTVLKNEPGVFAEASNHPAMTEQLLSIFNRLRESEEDVIEGLSRVNLRTADTVRLFRDYALLLEKRQLYDQKAAYAAAAECIKFDKSSLKDFGTVILHLLEPTPSALPMIEALKGKDALISVKASVQASGHFPLVSQIIITSDREEEVRFVIRQIMTHVNQGVPLYRMAIALRSADPYSRMVNDLLTAAGIAHNGNPASTLKESLAARTILDALCVADSEFGKAEVMHLVSDIPLQTPVPSQTTAWPRIIRQASPGRGLDGWRRGLGRFISQKGEVAARLDDDNAAQNLRQAEETGNLLVWLERLASLLNAAAEESWSAYSGWCLQLLDDLLDKEQLSEGDLMALDQVRQTLESLKALDLLSPFTTLEAYRSVLEGELRSEKPSVVAGKHGEGVFIGSFADVSAMDMDVVFIPGMAEGTVPAQPPTSAIITDGDCEAVGGGFTLSDISAESERSLFLCVVQSAAKALLICPQSDERAGRPLSPSRLLLEQATQLAGKEIYSGDLLTLKEPWITHLVSPYNSLLSMPPGSIQDYRTKSLVSHISSGKSEHGHYLYRNGLLKAGVDCLKARTSSEFTRFDGLVGEAFRADWSVTLSPTRLESYAKCPYSHFLRSLLEVEGIEDEPDTLWLDPAVKGLLYHTVFQRLINQFIGSLFQREPAIEAVKQIAEEEFEKLEAESLTGNPALWEMEKQTILNDFERFVDEEIAWRTSGYKPVAVESGFGSPPIEVVLSSGKTIRFRGRIDRVDINEDTGHAAVIDYKTGSLYPPKQLESDCTLSGKLLQHYIYGLFAKHITKASSAVGIYRMVTARGFYRQQMIAADEVNASRCETVVSALAETIENGVFPANPGSGGRSSHCTYCEYRQLCVPERMRQWRRKQGSERLLNYIGLSIGKEETYDDAE